MKSNPATVRRVLRVALGVLLPALLLAAVIYRTKFTPVPVQFHEVAVGPVVAEVMGTGTLEARIRTAISPRLQERLIEVLVDQDSPVVEGQLLARLDDAETRAQVALATASLAAASATVERVKADEARAEAVAKLARFAHGRSSELRAGNFIATAEMDKAVEQVEVAEADLNRARAAIVEAERQAVAAEMQLRFQQERLSFTRIVSPYDGLVVRRDSDPGEVVVPGGTLMDLVATNEIWVSAWVDETVLADLRTGQPVRVVFRSQPTQSHAGVVARLGRETDRETRELLVDVRLRELPPNWTLGQRANVFIETGRKPSALFVPRSFVVWRSGSPGVFVGERGRARWRPVTLGYGGMATVEVTQGLAEGERVVVSAAPGAQLTDGQRVVPP